MSFLLKIVEGPNKGAEIALVEGVAVTLGKSDECDIVLADPTLPSAPLSLEASADAVSMNGETLELFTVKIVGATAFAIGPSDAPWGELKWDRGRDRKPSETGDGKRAMERGSETRDDSQGKDDSSRAPDPESKDGDAPTRKRKHGGCCGCFVVLILLLLALGVLAWHYRHLRKPAKEFYDARLSHYVAKVANLLERKIDDRVETVEKMPPVTLKEVAVRYGLELEEGQDQAKLSGNLQTRAARLRATAEAYEARPGVELDLSDDESFRAAADDAVFTITEGAMKVVSATNRVLTISGRSSSPFALKRVLEALDADLPKLRRVDAVGVSFGTTAGHAAGGGGRGENPAVTTRGARRKSKGTVTPSLPVCGILTKPYPCLVMRDGSRVLEGASLDGNVIVKIDADAVTVTNATGRFTWKP